MLHPFGAPQLCASHEARLPPQTTQSRPGVRARVRRGGGGGAAVVDTRHRKRVRRAAEGGVLAAVELPHAAGDLARAEQQAAGSTWQLKCSPTKEALSPPAWLRDQKEPHVGALGALWGTRHVHAHWAGRGQTDVYGSTRHGWAQVCPAASLQAHTRRCWNIHRAVSIGRSHGTGGVRASDETGSAGQGHDAGHASY